MKQDFQLFSELYTCYYQVVKQILNHAGKESLTVRQMTAIVNTYGHKESALSIIPNLLNGTWPLLEQVRLKVHPNIHPESVAAIIPFLLLISRNHG